MRSVYAFDVKGRVGLCVTLLLCNFKDIREVFAFLVHRSQDIVAGAVQNAVKSVKIVCAKAFLNR